VGCCFQQKTCHISETGQDRTKVILLTTNRKLHTRFRLVPKSTTLDDLEGHYAPCFKTRAFFGAHHENLNEDSVTNASDWTIAARYYLRPQHLTSGG